MNPQSMMQFMGALNTFRTNHPKFAGFIGMVMKSGIPEGSVIEITVTKLLSDLHSLFGRDFTGGKALNHVVGKDFGSSCALLSDGSEVLACSCAVGSASIRVDI